MGELVCGVECMLVCCWPKADLVKDSERLLGTALEFKPIGTCTYHLYVDSSFDAGTYHGPPVEMPAEVQAANAAAEGLDARKK